jgi:hypothetical protein
VIAEYVPSSNTVRPACGIPIVPCARCPADKSRDEGERIGDKERQHHPVVHSIDDIRKLLVCLRLSMTLRQSKYRRAAPRQDPPWLTQNCPTLELC